MLQLAQWGAALGLNEAMNRMWSDQFVPDYKIKEMKKSESINSVFESEPKVV
jgi:hypothetical protein